jgi:hypothetical protein
MKTLKSQKLKPSKMGNLTFLICLLGLGWWIRSSWTATPQAKAASITISPVNLEPSKYSQMPLKTERALPEALPAPPYIPNLEEIRAAEYPENPPQQADYFNDEILARLEDTNKPLSSVCASLSNIDRKQNGKFSRKEILKRFEDSVLGVSRDPAIESIQPVLRFVLKRPELMGLLKLDPSTKGVDAASRTLRKYRALMMNQRQLEQVMDQSYLLLMLGRSIEKKPRLASATYVMQYCQTIEDDLNNLKATNFEADKKTFMEFLAASKIDPASIGFDPQYKTDLELEQDGNSYSFNVGWMKQYVAVR